MTETAAAKSRPKVFAVFVISLLAIGVLALLLWIGTFLYWHLGIRAVLRGWETRVARGSSDRNEYIHPPPGSEVLFNSGCRALPYLVDDLNSTRDPRFQEALMEQIESHLIPHGDLTEKELQEFWDRSSRWSIIAEGPEFERKEKIADFNAWWASHGYEYHQGWRVWESWCHGR